MAMSDLERSLSKAFEKVVAEVSLRAIKHFGITHQILKLGEECSELTRAIMRELMEPGGENHQNLKEELCDVYILLHQVMPMVMDQQEHDGLILAKLERLDQMISEREIIKDEGSH